MPSEGDEAARDVQCAGNSSADGNWQQVAQYRNTLMDRAGIRSAAHVVKIKPCRDRSRSDSNRLEKKRIMLKIDIMRTLSVFFLLRQVNRWRRARHSDENWRKPARERELEHIMAELSYQTVIAVGPHPREAGTLNTSITTCLVRRIETPQNHFGIKNPPRGHGAMKKKVKSVGTPRSQFFDEQLSLLQKRKTNELIDKHYHPDAVLISTTRTVRGMDALKQHFRGYVTMLGEIELVSLDALVESGDSVLIETTIRTSLGQARVYDAFVVRDSKVTHHFTGIR
jgi:SnoaL-like protein